MAKNKARKVGSTKTKQISTAQIIALFAKRLQNGTLSGEEHEIIGRYYLLQAPKKIYRYRPENPREITALCQNKIWFSALSELNDPFEFNGRADIESIIAAENDIQNQMQTMSFVQRQSLLKKVSENVNYDSFYRDILPNYTIACFSEIKDSLLMWGHYSSEHKGICVEYDTIALNSTSGKTVVPVTYSSALPALAGKDDTTIHRFILQIMSTKFTDWKYESEWRCIQDKGACGENWSPNGALLDSSSPTAIYLGCNAEGEFVDSLICACKDILQIPLYRMVKSRDEYALLPELIV